MAAQSMSALTTRFASALRSLALVALALVLSFGLTACSGGKAKAPTLSADDIAVIERQAEGFLAARDRLPELATLVNERDWTFTRNLIHGPMQEVGREMLYINQRLDRSQRKDADKIARNLKEALADLDEAARLQDSSRLQRSYSAVAAGFDAYSDVIPAEALS